MDKLSLERFHKVLDDLITKMEDDMEHPIGILDVQLINTYVDDNENDFMITYGSEFIQLVNDQWELEETYVRESPPKPGTST